MLELGIYGGTYAPVHNGHITAAESFLEQAGLDKLLIMPTLIPPHKQLSYRDDPQDRLNMLRLAFEKHSEYGKRIFISDYEINSPPPSYTVYTLRHFADENTRITFLCGTDMFLTLDKWKAPDEIFRLCRIALMPREAEISSELEALIDKRNLYLKPDGAEEIPVTSGISNHYVNCAMPIISEGDVIGCVVSAWQNESPTKEKISNAIESKLIQTAGVFLGKQMEN